MTFTVRPVGQPPHRPDWSTATRRDMFTIPSPGRPDHATSVAFARCRLCNTALTIMAPFGVEVTDPAAVVLEMHGTEVTR